MPSPTKPESQPCNGNFFPDFLLKSPASALEAVTAPIATISVFLRAFFTPSSRYWLVIFFLIIVPIFFHLFLLVGG